MKALRIFISTVQKSDGFATVIGRKAEEVTWEGRLQPESRPESQPDSRPESLEPMLLSCFA